MNPTRNGGTAAAVLCDESVRKAALITGGTAYFGRTMAFAFGRSGAPVLACGRRPIDTAFDGGVLRTLLDPIREPAPDPGGNRDQCRLPVAEFGKVTSSLCERCIR